MAAYIQRKGWGGKNSSPLKSLEREFPCPLVPLGGYREELARSQSSRNQVFMSVVTPVSWFRVLLKVPPEMRP